MKNTVPNRRDFLKKSALSAVAFAAPSSFYQAGFQGVDSQNGLLKITSPAVGNYAPLDSVTLQSSQAGKLLLLDAQGREYASANLVANVPQTFALGGALGFHQAVLTDKRGAVRDRLALRVDCQTELDDQGGKFQKLLKNLYWTMVRWEGETETYRYQDKFYFVFVRWLRDHVHTLKGMKYFYPKLHSGIDLYADTQREDGMIWDNIYPRDKEKNWWNRRFDYGGFIREIEGGNFEMKRIPIENDVEYLFLEGLYVTWKATGDDAWMAGHLDKALKAVRYATTDPYRWSEKYQLLKRGFTIDTWDFQSAEDAALVDGNDIMRVELGKTRFGVMFGDNTGMAAGCGYLADMLDHVGRKEEAQQMRELGETLRKRLNELSWNGQFFTHHVPEDTTVQRDLGVDQSQQVSLSNAYSLNRGLSHEQAAAIIRSYQRIRDNLPVGSPGEWYTIYPPFEKGYGVGDSTKKWQYMNAGVTPIVAGELAHGAFQHGFEAYGVDILQRVLALSEKTDGYLYCAYRGSMPETPPRTFAPLALTAVANAAQPPKAATSGGQWIGAERVRAGVEWNLPDPDKTPHTSIQINNQTTAITLPVGQKAASVYLLHTGGNGPVLGMMTLRFADGTTAQDPITRDKIGNWWIPANIPEGQDPICQKAWRTDNDHYASYFAYGYRVPHPDKVITSIEFRQVLPGQLWDIAAVTLSEQPVFFPPSPISYGIPDNWGAAAVVYALLEGLAGVKDAGVAFDRAHLSPRWESAGVNKVTATVKYEASGGYVRYAYQKESGQLRLRFTGSAQETALSVLLPNGWKPTSATLNGQAVAPTFRTVEQSTYAAVTAKGVGVHEWVLKG